MIAGAGDVKRWLDRLPEQLMFREVVTSDLPLRDIIVVCKPISEAVRGILIGYHQHKPRTVFYQEFESKLKTKTKTDCQLDDVVEIYRESLSKYNERTQEFQSGEWFTLFCLKTVRLGMYGDFLLHFHFCSGRFFCFL